MIYIEDVQEWAQAHPAVGGALTGAIIGYAAAAAMHRLNDRPRTKKQKRLGIIVGIVAGAVSGALTAP